VEWILVLGWLTLTAIAVGNDEEDKTQLSVLNSNNETIVEKVGVAPGMEDVKNVSLSLPEVEDKITPEKRQMKDNTIDELRSHGTNSTYFVFILLGLSFLAVRNRKRLTGATLWARESAGPVYIRLSNAMDQARKFPRLASIRFKSLMSSFASVSKGESGLSVRKASKPDDIELVPMNYEFTPQLLHYRISPILSKPVAKKIASHLPPVLQMDDFKLLFSSNEHGSYLHTLYSKARGHGPTVLIVKDQTNSVFGAFASESWRKGSFGTGQSFVFTMTPQVKVFNWAGKHSHFFNAQSTQLGIGGPKCAIWLDEKLRSGVSEECGTFGSPPLAKTTHFDCYGVELWGFTIPETLLSTNTGYR